MEIESLSNGNHEDERLICCAASAECDSTGLIEDARAGLMTRPRSLPPKYFYDDRGSRLFDAICETAEYYPTRTEDQLLRQYARVIVDSVRPHSIVELGSGSSRKTHHLLKACADLGLSPAYCPFDICESMVVESGRKLIETYEWLVVRGLVGDYLAGLDDIPAVAAGPRLFVFLGGTIGNFEPNESLRFLREIRRCMQTGDALLIGADRVKDPAVLNAAYNDADGLTGQFNLNVLNVLNRELGSDFSEHNFEHIAGYNSPESRIEMYLVANQTHVVNIPVLKQQLMMDEGEAILTEISRKFTPSSLENMLHSAGICVDRHFEPDNGYFSLLLGRPIEA